MNSPLVSVIVPTKNSAKYLERCLCTVREQNYKNIELIVVDNFSTDNTKEIAEKYADKVYEIGPERSSQRNYGAKMASGEILYFIDSDYTVPDKTLIECAVEKIINGYELVIIHDTSDPSISVWAKIRKFERDMYKYDDNNCAVRFMLKKAFESVKGYDENCIAGEDYDLHNRLIRKGYKAVHIDPEALHIGEPRSLKDVYYKNYYYGKTISSYISRNKDKALKQLSPIRPAYIKNWKKLVKNCDLTLLFIFYMIIKYIAGAHGFLVVKLAAKGR